MDLFDYLFILTTPMLIGFVWMIYIMYKVNPIWALAGLVFNAIAIPIFAIFYFKKCRVPFLMFAVSFAASIYLAVHISQNPELVQNLN